MFETMLIYLRVVIPTSIERIVLAIGAMFGTWFSLGVGGIDESFIVLCLFMFADIVTGVIAAIRSGEGLSSKKGAIGLFKKALIVFIVMMCNGVDEGLHVNFMRDACIFAYILNEALSNIENIERAGFGSVIPPFIKRALAQLRVQKRQQFDEKLRIKSEGEKND